MKALMEASGKDADSFDKELKMKGLMKSSSGKTDPKLSANYDLIQWLEDEGDVYMSPESTWGEAPHPMAISVETRDEITNEISGRGLLARRDINDGDELLKIPMKLCLTKKSARKALGKDALPSSINEYLAIACQLIHERYVMGDRSFWKAYIGILPETDEVNPTFTWSDEDLSFLEGSPVVAATESLRSKIRQEYEEMFLGENGLIKRFPDRFPEDVSVCILLNGCAGFSRYSWISVRCRSVAGLILSVFLSLPLALSLTHTFTHLYSFLCLPGLFVQELGMGLCNALLTRHPASWSRTGRDVSDGPVRRLDQSLAVLPGVR